MAINLNNQGVLHLDAGEYGKAAFAFKEASKLVLLMVAKELPVATAATAAESHRSTSTRTQATTKSTNHTAVDKTDKAQTTTTTQKRKMPANLATTTTTTVTLRPRKRARKTTDTPLPTTTPTATTPRKATPKQRQQQTKLPAMRGSKVFHVSGRPLWMKKTTDGKRGFRATTEAAIVLYNLGLTFQLNAGRLANKPKSQQWMHKRSLDLYNMAKELILGSPATHAFESPVFLVALHNMANLHQELGDARRVAATRKEIAAVLRLLRASNLAGIVKDRGYEGFYLKLLSLPPSDQLAAAA